MKELSPRSCKLEQAKLGLKPISVHVPCPPHSRLLMSRCLQDAGHVVCSLQVDASQMILNGVWGLGGCSAKRGGETEPQGRVEARVRTAEEGREPVGGAGRVVS